MANCCEFQMEITSTNLFGIKRFIKWICNISWPLTTPFIPTYDCEMDPESIIINEHYYRGVLIYSAKIFGFCRNSLASSMNSNTNHKKEPSFYNLREAALLNNTGVNVYSKEPGNCFEEWVTIDSAGIVIRDDCVEANFYYWDTYENETIEDFNKEHNTNFTEDDFDEDGYHIEGGFDEWGDPLTLKDMLGLIWPSLLQNL